MTLLSTKIVIVANHKSWDIFADTSMAVSGMVPALRYLCVQKFYCWHRISIISFLFGARFSPGKKFSSQVFKGGIDPLEKHNPDIQTSYQINYWLETIIHTKTITTNKYKYTKMGCCCEKKNEPCVCAPNKCACSEPKEEVCSCCSNKKCVCPEGKCECKKPQCDKPDCSCKAAGKECHCPEGQCKC